VPYMIFYKGSIIGLHIIGSQ